MAPIPLLGALLTLVGIAILLRATDGRMTVVGLGLALLPLPLVTGDSSSLLVLAFRTLAVLLALFLLDLGVRRTTPLVGAISLGGSAETAAVLAFWLIGLLLAGSDPAGRWPASALATALALAVAGLTLLAFGSDTLRLGTGATLAVAAGATLVPGLGGSAGDALGLALAAVLVAVGGVTAWLAVLGGGVRRDLELADRPRDVAAESTRRPAGPGLPRPSLGLPRPRLGLHLPDFGLRLPNLGLGLPDLGRRLQSLALLPRVAVAAVLAGLVLIALVVVLGPVLGGWLQGLGGSASVTSPSPTLATPTLTAVPTTSPLPTSQATPEPTAAPTPTPTAAPLTYVVVKGDTLGRIARRFGVTIAALQKANGITDPASLQIGQRLIIPRP